MLPIQIDPESAKAFSEVAQTLINRVFDTGSAIAAPRQLRRMADAQAYATTRTALADAEAERIRNNASVRLSSEAIRQQINIEAITYQAAQLLDDDAHPENVDEDWIHTFFEKNRNVSDRKMRGLWASILAGESQKPGSFSKRTLTVVADLEKENAQHFEILCSFIVIAEIPTADNMASRFATAPLFLSEDMEHLYASNGLNYEIRMHLVTLGLITHSALYNRLPRFLDGRPHRIASGNKTILVTPTPKTANAFLDGAVEIGNNLFTQAGLELANLCKVEANPDLLDVAQTFWRSRGHSCAPVG